MDSKNEKILLYFFVVSGIFLGLVIGIYDLDFSKSVVNTESNFGAFIRDFGDIPGFIVIVVALVIFYVNDTEWRDQVELKYLLLLTIIILNLIIYFRLFRSIMQPVMLVSTGLLISVICVWLIIYKLVSTKSTLEPKVQLWMKVTLAQAIIVPGFFVQIMKTVWGRVRFYDLDSLYSNYSPWYQINGINGHRSFPSGHTAMGWMLLPLLLLIVDLKPKRKILIYVGVIFWGLLVGWGRIIIGAHYASDVYFSTLLSFIGFIFLRHKLQKRDEVII
jgi:membrane-associated phospholipid phosphatase